MRKAVLVCFRVIQKSRLSRSNHMYGARYVRMLFVPISIAMTSIIESFFYANDATCNKSVRLFVSHSLETLRPYDLLWMPRAILCTVRARGLMNAAFSLGRSRSVVR
mmetsp:Transcript_8928/g.17281  ORF Transcript_8928/g.17281 Transcript_8928/m.17281 type:complete len:107 (+) Transcript_8928:256-576(+)